MKTSYYYFLVVFFSLILTVTMKNLLNLEELTYSSLSEELSKEQIEKYLELQDKWQWTGYLILPLIILLRSALVSLCLNLGYFFYDVTNKIKFKQFFRIAVIGEFVLLTAGYFKLIYFYFIKTDFTIEQLQQFYPLSYTNFLNISKLEPWLIYPLQTINLFEIAYFFMLVFGVHKLLQNKYIKSFEIVTVSYGTGLIIWLGLIMFLTLNIS